MPITVYAREFAQTLKRLAPMMGGADLPMIHGVYFERTGGGVTLSATNRFVLGSTLIRVVEDVTDGDVELTALIPGEFVQKLVREYATAGAMVCLEIDRKVDEEARRVVWTATPIYGGLALTYIASSLSTGDFPRWRQLFPAGEDGAHVSEIAFDAARMGDVLGLRRSPSELVNVRWPQLPSKPIGFLVGSHSVAILMPVRESQVSLDSMMAKMARYVPGAAVPEVGAA